MYYKAIDSKSGFYIFEPLAEPKEFHDTSLKILKYGGDVRQCLHSFLVDNEFEGYFENQICIDKFDES